MERTEQKHYVIYAGGNVHIVSTDGDNNTSIIGSNNIVEKVMDEIAEQRMVIANAQRQIERLLNVIDRTAR